MEYLIMAAIAFGAFIVGAYCFNGFVVPLFYSLPRFRKEKAEDNLVKPFPMLKLLLTPFLAVLVFGAALYFAYPYYVEYPLPLYIGFGIALIGVYAKMKSTKGEKEKEFEEKYGEYLKKA